MYLLSLSHLVSFSERAYLGELPLNAFTHVALFICILVNAGRVEQSCERSICFHERANVSINKKLYDTYSYSVVRNGKF